MDLNRKSGVWERIVNNSLDIICTTDKDGYFLNINNACERILGYQCSEMAGRHFSDFLLPDDLPNTLSRTQEVFNSHKVTSFDNHFIHKKGRKVPITWSSTWSEEDQLMVSVGRDNTEQQMVRKKELLHQALVEHGSDMLSLFDEELNLLYSGSSIFREFGYRPEQIQGTSVFERIHPQDIPLLKETLAKVLASGGHSTIPEFRYRNAAGEWRWLETTLSNQLHKPAVKALVASSRDITERINNRLKLRESEQRFKSLFDHHLDIVLFQNTEGEIIDLNAAALSFFGVPKETVLNRPFSDFVPPEIVPVCRKKLQEALKGQSVRFELAIPFEAKGCVNFEIAKIPVVVNDETVGVYSIFRDITEITRSTEIIRQQATKLNTIFESITDAFFTLDRNWNFTYVNSEFNRLLKTGREDLFGINIWEVIPEEIDGPFHKQYQHALESGKAVHFDAYLKRKDIWLQVKAFPSEEGLSVYFDDISEKVRSKEALEKLSLVASKTTNGVIIMNADGLAEWVNEGFTKLTGYTFAELAGTDPCNILHGEETDPTTVKRIFDKIKEGKPFKDEIVNYKKSGEKMWLLLDMTPVLNDHGQVSRLIIIQTDITFRKEAEARQLKLTQELFRQNRDLQQFTYVVSHNLRAPVANTMGLVNLLACTEPGTRTFDVSLNYLETSVQKMDSILRDLNLILSIRNKEGVFEKEKVSLAPVCRQAIEALKEPLRDCGGEILMDIEEGINVGGNKTYFYSIFTQLLSNAVKYRSPKRPLKISIKSVRCTEEGTVLSFSDNGSGFDLNLAGDKVFQIYKQFHSNAEGKGMGLFLVKTYLEKMGGHIEVNSQVNTGTSFTLYLR